MSHKKINSNKQKMQALLLNILIATCALPMLMIGCTDTQQSNEIQTSAEMQQKQLAVVRSVQSSTADTTTPQKQQSAKVIYDSQNKVIAPMSLPTAHGFEDSSQITQPRSTATTVQGASVRNNTQPQLDTTNQASDPNKQTPANKKRLVSEPTVNIPLLEKSGMADELISVNFDQVDIRTVLKTIGDITGINFVIDDSVRGNVTVMSPTKIPLNRIYYFLESILEVHGYAAVPADGLVKIVPRQEAVKRNLQVRIGSDPSEIARNDSVVTQIIPLTYADASEVGQIIQPLLATGSQMAVYPKTNSIVVTDTSSNIHHIAKIIDKLDVEDSKESVTVLALNYASAQVIGEQVTRIMEQTRIAATQPARTRGSGPIETGIRILPDSRTNSLVVVANPRDTATVRELVRQLDIQRPVGADNIHVVYLKNAQAKQVAESLTAAVANLRITGAIEATQPIQATADEGTNSLIIAASPQDYEVIAGIVESLDIVREQVLVEMLIVEVSEEALREIGIDWATLDEAVSSSVRFFGSTNFGPRVDFTSGNLEGLAIGAWKATGTDVKIGAILHALEKESGINILSTPHVLTSNHNKAKIIVGENRPFVMESRITETDPFTPTVIKTYEYKDVGITLEITPHISQGGLIRLEINTQFTKLIEDVTSPSSDTPTTAKREAQTVISMNSGSTVVIGGLIRDDKVSVEQKVPFVGDFPIVGNLFKHRKDQLQKTNLLIFITPYVMTDQADLEKMTKDKQEQMNAAIEGHQETNKE